MYLMDRQLQCSGSQFINDVLAHKRAKGDSLALFAIGKQQARETSDAIERRDQHTLVEKTLAIASLTVTQDFSSKVRG